MRDSLQTTERSERSVRHLVAIDGKVRVLGAVPRLLGRRLGVLGRVGSQLRRKVRSARRGWVATPAERSECSARLSTTRPEGSECSAGLSTTRAEGSECSEELPPNSDVEFRVRNCIVSHCIFALRAFCRDGSEPANARPSARERSRSRSRERAECVPRVVCNRNEHSERCLGVPGHLRRALVPFAVSCAEV
jgi:hypothetical protein